MERLPTQLSALAIRPWQLNERLGIVGIGAAHNSGHTLAAVLAESGRSVVNVTATDVEAGPPGHQIADHYLLVTESGRSPEPLNAARRLTTGCRTAITNDASSPIVDAVDSIVDLGGFPDSGVYTVGYSATLLAYALLLEHQAVRTFADVRRLPDLFEAALTTMAPAADAAAIMLQSARAVDVVGAGPSYGSATEIALLLREGLRLPSAAYNTHEYLHGPMESAFPDTPVIVIGDGRERDIIRALRPIGVPTIHITTAGATDDPSNQAFRIEPDLDPLSKAVLEVAAGHLLLERGIALHAFELADFRFTGLGTKLDE